MRHFIVAGFFVLVASCGKFSPLEVKLVESDLSAIVEPDPVSCDGNILSGTKESRTRYKSSHVPTGATCESEKQSRTCQAGKFSEWSGNFAFESCAVGGGTTQLASCDGATHGSAETRTRFQMASVPNGSTCQQETQTRTCYDGTYSQWTGTFSHETCSVLPPTTTVTNNPCGTTPHGTVQSRTYYATASVAYNQTCSSQTQTRTCQNGTFTSWSGSYTFASCSVQSPASCGTTPHLEFQERTRYAAASVPYGSVCSLETQKSQCMNGTFGAWSGSFTELSCTAQASPEVLLSAGVYRRYCATIGGDKVKCWGSNNQYELGLGHSNAVTSPTQTSFIATQLVGNSHTCGLFAGNQVKCWGLNNYGQLGHGNVSNANSVGSTISATNVKKVIGGSRHTCVLHLDNSVSCFGDNNQGQLGIGASFTSSSSARIITGFAALDISSSGDQTCGVRISDNSVFCWGNLTSNNVLESVKTPRMITNLKTKTVSSGYSHSCGLTLQNKVVCWGGNFSGQLGQGHTNGVVGFVEVPNIAAAKSVSSGGNHSCAILMDDTVTCWGANSLGQLGRGGISTYGWSPVAVVDGLKAKQVEMGIDSTCAVTLDNELKCWGGNQSYQLGLGHTSTRVRPETVPLN